MRAWFINSVVQCGPVCPETCDNDYSVQCPSGCVEGCFCPTGMVLSNGQCINESDCEGAVLGYILCGTCIFILWMLRCNLYYNIGAANCGRKLQYFVLHYFLLVPYILLGFKNIFKIFIS